MNKKLGTCFIIFFAFVTIHTQHLNTPLVISGHVYNSNGETLEKGALRFRVFLDDEPESYLSETSPSCGYEPPVWYAELGNLQTDWYFGDLLIIIFDDTKGNEHRRFTWIIDSTAMVPDIQTQKISQNDLINEFKLSDNGVFHHEPVKFSFHSVFSELPDVELNIFDSNGREVYKTGEPETQDFEHYQFTWEGKSNDNQQIRSGIYYYFIKVDGKIFHSGVVTLKNE